MQAARNRGGGTIYSAEESRVYVPFPLGLESYRARKGLFTFFGEFQREDMANKRGEDMANKRGEDLRSRGVFISDVRLRNLQFVRVSWLL